MHNFTLNLIIFYHVFFDSLELYSECSRKWKVICQNQAECRYGESHRALKSSKMFRIDTQHLEKRATLVSNKAVGCYPLTDEPLDGACTHICEFGSTSRSGFWLWYHHPYVGIANDTHNGAVSHTWKIGILKHYHLLLPPPTILYIDIYVHTRSGPLR